MPQLTTVVTKVESITNSPSGNPRFRFSTLEGTFITEADSSFNYDVENDRQRLLTSGQSVVLGLTPRNTISGYYFVEGQA